MSIYATMWDTSSDDHTTGDEGPFCGKWVQVRKTSAAYERARLIFFDGRRYNLDPKKPCSCGAGTLPYGGSHILPGEQPADGHAEIALIPGHIERDGREDEQPPDDQTPWPYLRLGVGSPEGRCTVVLSEQHVKALHESLTYWLEARGALS